MIKIENIDVVDGVKLITPDVHEDYRGKYVETWNKREYDFGLDFVVDDYSISRKNTFRGLHGDNKTWKLIQCLDGKILQVVLDVRLKSPTYGNIFSVVLSRENRKQVLIPSGCANGHFCLSDECMFHYKQTEYYENTNQFQYHVSSLELLGFDFPSRTQWHQLILSRRDKTAPIWRKS